MIRLGKTYGDLMVDVRSSNEKLAARARRVVRLAAGVSDEEAERALAEADGSAKVAVVALLAGVDADDRARAARAGLGPRAGGARAMRLGVEAALVGGQLVPGDVELAGGEIAAYGLAGRNGGGCIAVPGFLDLQVNGFGGVDFMGADADGYARGGEALLETGVTAYLPTFISAPEEDLLAALGNVPLDPPGPRLLGVHLEGPFLSEKRLGVHPRSARRDPDPALLERLLGAGPVRLMTLAPELPGRRRADRPAARARDRGLVRALRRDRRGGRTRPSTAARSTVTHLFNAMRPFGHRDPGLVGAALAREDVIVQIILDGVHLAEETARLVWRSAAGRVALVTDAVAGAGMGDGDYLLAGSEIDVRDGVVRGLDDVLAGSALTMIEAMRNLHALGVPAPRGARGGDLRPGPRARPSHGRPPRRRVPGRPGRARRQPRDRPRLHRRRSACRCLRPPRCPRPLGADFLAEIRSQPQALRALLEHEPVYAEAAARARERRATTIRMVGHGSSDNAASYGVYAFGLLPHWTALRDSIALTVHYDTRSRWTARPCSRSRSPAARPT